MSTPNFIKTGWWAKSLWKSWQPFWKKNVNNFQNYKIRTTNSVESWHSKLQKATSRRHLNIYEFILLLKNQQLIFENEIAFLDVGHTPTAKRPKYRQIDEKIEPLTNQYLKELKNDLTFLETVTHWNWGKNIMIKNKLLKLLSLNFKKKKNKHSIFTI